jgi:hypothetical protein
LDENPPRIGEELHSELIFDVEDPVAIMVHKSDSTKTFVAHRGIINEELLLDYLLNHVKEYNELIMDFRSKH